MEVEVTPIAGKLGSRPDWGVVLAKRVGSGVLFIPFFVLLTGYAPGWMFALFIVLVAGVAQWEYARMVAGAGLEIHRLTALLAGLLVTASFAWRPATHVALTLAVAGVLISGLWSGWSRGPRWGATATTLMGVMYVNWLLGHVLWLRALPHGVAWVFLLVWVTWVGEAAAYCVGSTLGRHQLAPVMSPAKTVEGALVQLMVSPAAALVGRWWFFPESTFLDALSVGLILGIVGQVGDLAESFFKRSCGTKDTGGLIPGHGGVLDRIDSLLLNAPALLYYGYFLAE
ncbi:MAG: phosphatidate cytidylyltransferase, partial [Candidatus Methylomirabilales bacterium]